MSDPRCRYCPAPLLWATSHSSGKPLPLDPPEVEPEVGKRIVAYNPASGRGVMVTARNIDDCGKWAAKGVTFHVSHWATCAGRDQARAEYDAKQAGS
jgi:hypothetical protein